MTCKRTAMRASRQGSERPRPPVASAVSQQATTARYAGSLSARSIIARSRVTMGTRFILAVAMMKQVPGSPRPRRAGTRAASRAIAGPIGTRIAPSSRRAARNQVAASRSPRFGRPSRFVSASAASQPVIGDRKSLPSSWARAMASRPSADIGSPLRSQIAACVSNRTPASAVSPCRPSSGPPCGENGHSPVGRSAW
jgi:hypothetical protein